VCHRDHHLRATCELQGYAYDAKVRAARLSRLVDGHGEEASTSLQLGVGSHRHGWLARV
jgi:hypothetical protein